MWETNYVRYAMILRNRSFRSSTLEYFGLRNIMMERMINMVLDNATVNTVTVDADGNTVE